MNQPDSVPSKTYLPREHGATAMLFTPMVCVAILARTWHWAELATVVAAFAALSAKDPVVLLLRERLVWKRPHANGPAALKWTVIWSVLLAVSGIVLLFTWPWLATLSLALALGSFSALAVWVNVKNKQRSTLFQILSAAALTSSSLAMSLSAAGHIAPWCWWLWVLLAAQAATGILVVHARLDARIALKGKIADDHKFRRAAWLSITILIAAAVLALLHFHRPWLTAALILAALGYTYDLRAQLHPINLEMPLKTVGLRALTLSSIYSTLLIVGLYGK